MFIAVPPSGHGRDRDGYEWVRGYFLFLYTLTYESYWTFNGTVVSRQALTEDEMNHTVHGQPRKFPFAPYGIKEPMPGKLFLVSGRTEKNYHGGTAIRGIVLGSLKLAACGHSMMGSKTKKLPNGAEFNFQASGSYGGDGLPCDATPELWPYLHDLPIELQDTFWRGEGGHNTAGSEGPAVKEWARANLKKLTKFSSPTKTV